MSKENLRKGAQVYNIGGQECCSYDGYLISRHVEPGKYRDDVGKMVPCGYVLMLITHECSCGHIHVHPDHRGETKLVKQGTFIDDEKEVVVGTT